MKLFLFFALTVFCVPFTFSQDIVGLPATREIVAHAMPASNAFNNVTITADPGKRIYNTSFKKDAPIVIAGVGLTYLGVTLIENKKS